MEKRRQFLKVTLGFLSGMALLLSPFFSMIGSVYAKAKRIIVPKGTKRESLIGENPANLDARNLDITPLKDFGTMGITNHEVNLENWRLEVAGHVKRPLKLKYSDILTLPSIERDVLMICPGIFVNHGQWKGISVLELLRKAKMEKEVELVTFAGPEGEYEKVESYHIKDILSDKVFLAYEVNGKTLPQRHGFPIRVVAEDYYGDRWVKYVHKVTAK